MTAVVQLPTEQVSMTFDCDGHMGAGVDLPVGLLAADGGVSRDAGEPYRLAVTTTGNVSAGELFVLNHD
jgi:hypothetical protein